MVSQIVSKFGGTSMSDANCMRRSAEVAAQQKSRLIVVSATSGTTNDLILLGKTAQSGQWPESEALLQKIRSRHEEIGQELTIRPEQQNKLAELLTETESIARGIFLLKDCSQKALDTLMSLGERLSSVLFAKAMEEALHRQGSALPVRWLDAREVLKTDDQYGKARALTEEISRSCREKWSSLLQGEIVGVTQGFIGSTEEGATTTLGRGGSDYSAALLAEGISADVLQVWTDVPGIATTDPRICAEAKPIEEISFKEASELATFGAKILHPATLLPAIRRNIPVFVGSSFDAAQRGTWVRREVKEAPLVRALALRRKQVLVTLSTPEMLHAHGFLAKIFRVFDEHKVSVDAITTSEISVSLTLEDSALLNKRLLQDLSQFAEVKTEENLTLISMIGNSINHTSGLGKRIFDAIGNINVRMICLGASKHNFCFLVDGEKADETIRRLHRSFIET